MLFVAVFFSGHQGVFLPQAGPPRSVAAAASSSDSSERATDPNRLVGEWLVDLEP